MIREQNSEHNQDSTIHSVCGKDQCRDPVQEYKGSREAKSDQESDLRGIKFVKMPFMSLSYVQRA